MSSKASHVRSAERARVSTPAQPVPLIERFVAPDAHAFMSGWLGRALATADDGEILDVGCGATPRLRPGRAVGIDPNRRALLEYKRRGDPAAAASATALPFRDGHFAAALCVGLLHHLNDSKASLAVGEMLRVTRPGGIVVIVDAVWPDSLLARPFATLVRMLDRGRHVRTEARLRELLATHGRWHLERHTYTRTGLEALFASFDDSDGRARGLSRGIARCGS